MITAVCVTFGRVRFLESALGDFLAQENPGDCELLIVSTFPKQKLLGSFPNVRIINLDKRPPCLGEARNRAVIEAQGDRIIVWDDDDLYLPHHIATFQKHWTPGLDWVWLDKRFSAFGDKLVDISVGCHGGCFGFSKRAWQTVGGYPQMTVGEDRVLVQKITKLPGKRISIGEADMPPFIACWGNGSFHVSGEGDDKPNIPGAHIRVASDLTRRLVAGQEKTGEITLHPRHDSEWMRRAKSFLELKKNSVSDIGIVQLGRYGDIINILPIAQHIATMYGKPSLMISREFAGIFDGVSYVKPYPVRIPFHDINEGMRQARQLFRTVIQCQIYGGGGYKPDMKTDHFNMESWRYAGFLHEFHNPEWRLVFDRRNPKMEAAIAGKCFRTNLPKVVTNLTRGVSAPLPAGADILAMIRANLDGKFEVVDVGSMRFPSFHDLIGIIERAALFVTIDTATLHLAAACNVPMIAMVRDGWVGAEPRYGCVEKFTYSEATANPDAVVNSVQKNLCNS